MDDIRTGEALKAETDGLPMYQEQQKLQRNAREALSTFSRNPTPRISKILQMRPKSDISPLCSKPVLLMNRSRFDCDVLVDEKWQTSRTR